MLLIDSSAIVKYFSKEPGWEVIEQYIEESCTISLAMAELGSALLKKLSHGEISQDLALQLLDTYSRSVILLDQNKYLADALNVAAANKLSIYDSFFIAAALAEGYGIVSCDEKQIKVARNLGINTIIC